MLDSNASKKERVGIGLGRLATNIMKGSARAGQHIISHFKYSHILKLLALIIVNPEHAHTAIT
jgi:hypothetical protein